MRRGAPVTGNGSGSARRRACTLRSARSTAWRVKHLYKFVLISTVQSGNCQFSSELQPGRSLLKLKLRMGMQRHRVTRALRAVQARQLRNTVLLVALEQTATEMRHTRKRQQY